VSTVSIRPDLSLEAVLAAREAIGGRLQRTPMLGSATLSELTRAPVRLKAELFQRTGSFKVRGVLTKLAALTEDERARGVIGISAGNHAQALAYGAREAGLSALLVMWAGANPAKVAATRGYGADADLVAAGPAEAFERLDELIEQTGRTLVHPFDDPLVIAGQGTVGLELVEDVPDVDVVVVPVGGGGLISGIATAVKGLRPQARIVAVEPELAPTLHEALKAARSVPVEPRSVADGLNAPFAGEHAVAICSRLGVESVLVSEGEIEEGFRFLYARAKLACEPAGAAATAALLAGKIPLQQGDDVVAVVSGGNAAPEIASAILARR
jgi:threonine dehydratase